MRAPWFGWLLIGATAALALWGALALVRLGRAMTVGEVRALRVWADSLLVTDGSALCRQADVPRGRR